MKKFILTITSLIIITSSTFGQKKESSAIGKIVLFSGKYEKTLQTSGTKSSSHNKFLIFPGDRIKTNKKSRVTIMLKKGASIKILSNSSVDFISIRTKKIHPPGKIKIDYGKFKLYLKHNFNDTSYIITTRTALIKAVYGKINIIASEHETMAFVKYNKIGITNINPIIKRAYILKENEEIKVSQNRVPKNLTFIPKKYRESWLYRYLIIDRHRYIVKSNRDDEFLDWLIRKREF